jgi:hypothetical protein
MGSGCSDSLLLAKRDPWVGQEFLVSFSLFGLDLGQHVSEPLVGDDVGLRDAPLCLERTERKTPLPVAKLDAAIGVGVDSAPLASKRECLGAHHTPRWSDRRRRLDSRNGRPGAGARRSRDRGTGGAANPAGRRAGSRGGHARRTRYLPPPRRSPLGRASAS